MFCIHICIHYEGRLACHETIMNVYTVLIYTGYWYCTMVSQ